MPKSDKNYINKLKLQDTHTFVILNGSYQKELSDECNEFVFNEQTLKIPKNRKIQKPIHLLLLTSQNCDRTISINIIAEENSRFTIIEEHAGIENCTYINNIKININAKNNSEIIYYKLQTENNASIHNAETVITQEQDSKIRSFFIGKGAKTARDILQVELKEKNASYDAIGIISLHDSQALAYQVRIEHLAPGCTSNILFKGIINDNATGDFNARIIAHPGAYKTETHVTNKNLLLSESAVMNTTPELEIYTDDVICTHGATVGQLDLESLFYLRSRGLSEDRAIQLLTTAFTQEIIDQFDEFFKPKIAYTNIDNDMAGILLGLNDVKNDNVEVYKKDML